MNQLRTFFFGGPPPPPFFEGTSTDFPHYDLISLDDGQVEELARKLKVPFAETQIEPIGGGGYSNTFLYFDHPTHWLMFTRYWGYPKENDNGLTLNGWLKATCDRAGFEAHLQEFLSNRQVDPASIVRINNVPFAP